MKKYNVYRGIIDIQKWQLTCRGWDCTAKGWPTNGLTAPPPHRDMANLVSHSRSTASGFGSPPYLYGVQSTLFPREKKERERERERERKGSYGVRSIVGDLLNPRSSNLNVSHNEAYIHTYVHAYILNRWLDEQHIHLTNCGNETSLWLLSRKLPIKRFFIQRNLWKEFVINLWGIVLRLLL